VLPFTAANVCELSIHWHN